MSLTVVLDRVLLINRFLFMNRVKFLRILLHLVQWHLNTAEVAQSRLSADYEQRKQNYNSHIDVLRN